VVYLVKSVALGLVTDKAGGYGADSVGGGHGGGSLVGEIGCNESGGCHNVPVLAVACNCA
jgi:hypothetical protein